MGESKGRRPQRRRRGVLVALVLMAAMPLTAASAGAVAPRPTGCLWVGPAHSQGRFNAAFPDTGAVYWTATMSLPVGSSLVLSGRYPHARYMSFNAYDDKGDATASLSDVAVTPDRGSINPFVAGAPRTAVHRSYAVSVVPAVPTRPLPRNTLEAGVGRQVLFYRVYLPDRGSGLTGGVGLPAASLHLADGRILTGRSACRAMAATRTPPPSQAFPLGAYDQLRDQPGRPATFPASNPPEFHRVFNVPALVQCVYRSQCAGHPVLSPGQYSNLDNAYVAATVSRAFRAGPVLVLTGTMPTTPITGPHVRTMARGRQLRYWSICQNESLATTRVAACLADDRVPLGPGRRYTIVSSTPADRPHNAIARCGVAWLAWPANGDGAGHPTDGLLIIRNLLAARGFDRAIGQVRRPGLERPTMGATLPTGRYTTTGAFEDRGCPRHPR